MTIKPVPEKTGSLIGILSFMMDSFPRGISPLLPIVMTKRLKIYFSKNQNFVPTFWASPGSSDA